MLHSSKLNSVGKEIKINVILTLESHKTTCNALSTAVLTKDIKPIVVEVTETRGEAMEM